MGRKTNSNSLRIKKTNKDYNDCWYGDILYSAHFSRSLKIQKSLSNSLNTADISFPKYSLIGAQKRADILLCYLDPKTRKQGCDKYNIKFHGSVSKNFCVKKKKDQNVMPVALPVSSLGHIEYDALPTLLNYNQWMPNKCLINAEQARNTLGFAYKSEAKYTQKQEQSILIKQTSLPFAGFAEWEQKGLCFHRRSIGCGSQDIVDLERLFFPIIASNPYSTHTQEGAKVSSSHGSNGGPTLTAKVCLLSPQKNKRRVSQWENNNILTFKSTYERPSGSTRNSAPKAEILYGYLNGGVEKPVQGNISMEPTEYLQKPFSPHLQSFFFDKNSKKPLFFTFLMGICAFRKNSYITGKSVNFWSTMVDVTFQQKQGFSCANNTKHYCVPYLNHIEKQAYVWNLSHCYTDFWGSFLSLCFFKSNNEKACAHFLCCYVSYFLERKVLFRTIKQQLSASLNASKQKKDKNMELYPYDNYRAFIFKNKSKIAGVRISCSGRVGGRSKKAQRSRKDTFMWGETGLHVFSRRLDFAKTTAETAFGAVGIQAWICFKG